MAAMPLATAKAAPRTEVFESVIVKQTCHEAAVPLAPSIVPARPTVPWSGWSIGKRRSWFSEHEAQEADANHNGHG